MFEDALNTMHVACPAFRHAGCRTVQRKTLATKRCSAGARSIRHLCRSFDPDLVDVQQQGQLPHQHAAAAQAAAAAGGPARNASPYPSAANQQYNQQRRSISPVLVLTGAAAAIVSGVVVIWLSHAGVAFPAGAGAAAGAAADGLSAGTGSSQLAAAAARVAAQGSSAVVAVLQHLWSALSEVRSSLQLA